MIDGVKDLDELVSTEHIITIAKYNTLEIGSDYSYVESGDYKKAVFISTTNDDGKTFSFSGSHFVQKAYLLDDAHGLKNLKKSETIKAGQMDLSGMKLIWNFPDNDFLTCKYLPGHVLAPNALVTINGGCFEGGYIADSILNYCAEGHFYPYGEVPESPEEPSTPPTQTPTQTSSPSEEPTPDITPTKTPSTAPSATPSAITTPDITPSDTPSPSPSVTPTPSEVPTPSPSVAPTPSEVPTPSPSAAPTPSEVPTPSPSAVPTPTAAPSPTPSVVPTPTPWNPPPATVTPTPNVTVKPTASATPSATPNATVKPTASAAPSATPGATTTPTASASVAPSVTPDATAKPVIKAKYPPADEPELPSGQKGSPSTGEKNQTLPFILITVVSGLGILFFGLKLAALKKNN